MEKLKILVMGLPGSGKTTLADKLGKLTNFTRINADEIRRLYNDWDFSYEGRLRQATRLNTISNNYSHSITDFVAPTEEIRNIFNADIIIWMDTIIKSKYKDTNSLFNFPANYDYRIKTKEADKWSKLIINELF